MRKKMVARVFPCPGKCNNGWKPTGKGTTKPCSKCNGMGHIVKMVPEYK